MISSQFVLSKCQAAMSEGTGLDVNFIGSNGKSITISEYLRAMFNIKMFKLLKNISSYNQTTGILYNRSIKFYIPYTDKSPDQIKVSVISQLRDMSEGNRLSYYIFRLNKFLNLNLFQLDWNVIVEKFDDGIKIIANPIVKFFALQKYRVIDMWQGPDLISTLADFQNNHNAVKLESDLDKLINNKILANRINDLPGLISNFDNFLSEVERGNIKLKV